VRATPLNAEHQSQLLAYLKARQTESVFLLAMLQRRPLGDCREWWGAWRTAEQLLGLAFTSDGPTSAGPGLWVLAGDAAAAQDLAGVLRPHPLPAMCIGPRTLVDQTWACLSDAPVTLGARSRSFHCAAVRSCEHLPVRPAQMTDLDWLRSVSIAMMQEDLGLNPAAVDPQAHEARLRGNILTGRSWIGLAEGERVFRLEVGTRCDYGVQVGGTWVPPHARGQGFATRGMAAVCTLLLERSPLVTLHVREDNQAAVACYGRVGFKAGAPLRLILR
jgi:GNAT superfamily N-acetyltransferase